MTAEPIDQTREDYRAKLGTEFGDIYYLCLAEWVDLVGIWKQYENLFGHNPEKVDFLNEKGGAFFYNVERLFFSAVVLGLCRLSDREKSMGKENLTVRRLHGLMDTQARKDKFKLLEKSLETTTDFARGWRNLYIAHNDLALKQGFALPLAATSIVMVNNAIDCFHSIFNFISVEFMCSDFSKRVQGPLNDEMDMMHRLYLGSLKEKVIQGEINQGIFDSLQMPSWYSYKER